jgi:hypothetical protein
MAQPTPFATLIAAHPARRHVHAHVLVRLDSEIDGEALLHAVAEQLDVGRLDAAVLDDDGSVFSDDDEDDDDQDADADGHDGRSASGVLGFRQGATLYPASVIARFPSMLLHPGRSLEAVIAGVASTSSMLSADRAATDGSALAAPSQPMSFRPPFEGASSHDGALSNDDWDNDNQEHEHEVDAEQEYSYYPAGGEYAYSQHDADSDVVVIPVSFDDESTSWQCFPFALSVCCDFETHFSLLGNSFIPTRRR